MSNFYEDYIDKFNGEYFDVSLLPKIYFVFSQLEYLMNNFFSARNKYLDLNLGKYNFESIKYINQDSFDVKFSHDYGCMCSSRCNYESDIIEVPFSALFYTEDQLEEYFRPLVEAKKLEEEIRLEQEKIRLEKDLKNKEDKEKELLAQLKAKYE